MTKGKGVASELGHLVIGNYLGFGIWILFCCQFAHNLIHKRRGLKGPTDAGDLFVKCFQLWFDLLDSSLQPHLLIVVW